MQEQSCFCHKIIGINEDACINTVCLTRFQLNIFRKVLQYFRDHLACARCVWFDIGKYRIFNDFTVLSVVIEYTDRVGTV